MDPCLIFYLVAHISCIFIGLLALKKSKKEKQYLALAVVFFLGPLAILLYAAILSVFAERLRNN